ncbi:uncharacterized protein LOC114182647 [Vigna unguiculata]|uniref:uncharacterized protein LOC114182647 n=1 Tax=Vigna unguiculata TaxID=3917 RepID=UPI001015FFBA|nr:uncharacterized protein LOC114182647 [Vigna unguiculata]XP_027925358.1 uncharacterized protein LOC114182647 [Vigna unguiculata]
MHSTFTQLYYFFWLLSATKRMDVDSVPKLKFSSPSGRSDLSSHLKPPKIQSRVRRNTPITPTKRIPMFPNEVKEGNKTLKASGKCCHLSYSSVGKNFCCISPLVSIDWFSSASSVTESVGSHVSFHASRTEKPSGLRMPSPNIGYFDMDNNLLVSTRAVSEIQSGQMLKDARNSRTCTWKTRDANTSRITKFGRSAVSKDGEVKDYLTKDEKMINSRAHEHAFERKTCAKVDKRGVGNKISREREEQSCLKSKALAERTHRSKYSLHRK